MDVRIHRGASEIGGSCVELRHDGATMLLDLGRPLSAARDEHVPLPPAIGLDGSGSPPLGVVISHGHQDHWGLVPQLPADIPLWIGERAADILRAAAFWGAGVDLCETGHLRHHEPFRVGPFTVTPYLADHSAFDAYSLLVEAGGRRLLYSGDLRGHGRKAAAFDALLADPPPGVHALLLEGTNLRDPGAEAPEPIIGESAVEHGLIETLRRTEGPVVVLASAQNIDRLVTVYRAGLQADRNLAVDLYTAEIAVATGRESIPRPAPDWHRVRAYLPVRQRRRVKDSGEFCRTEAVRPHRVFDEHLADSPGAWVLFGAYQSHLGHMIRTGLLRGGAVVWSMWDGYLAEPAGQRLTAELAAAGVPLVHHHTSGHASPADLRRLVDAIDPEAVVPIHTDAPHRYGEALGRQPAVHADGTWWPV